MKKTLQNTFTFLSNIKLIKMLKHNFSWKLLALLIAILLWAGLILQDPTLVRELSFNNVPISIIGESTLKENGFIVSSGLENFPQLSKMHVTVPQSAYNSVSPVNYSPRIDLTKITTIGEQNIDVITTKTQTYGTVELTEPTSFPIVVENYITNHRVPVVIQLFGEYPANYYGTPPIASPSVITVSGPESLVEKVASIHVNLQKDLIPERAGSSSTALPIQIINHDGEIMDNKLLEVSLSGLVQRSIIVETELFPTKNMKIDLFGLTEGTPAAGYEVKNITASPDSVLIAGDKNQLESLDTIFIDTLRPLTDLTENYSVEVPLNFPSDFVYKSANSVMINIEIAPKIITKEFSKLPIAIINNSKDLTASLSEKYINVSVTGPELFVNELTNRSINASVTIENSTQTGDNLPLKIYIENSEDIHLTYTSDTSSLEVKISKNDSK